MSASEKHDVFQAIADPTRRKVLQLLAEGDLPISEITSHFSMSRTAIAKHLHILSEAELVSGRKVGREKRFRLQPEPLAELKQWLSFYDQFWDNKLSILKHVIENSGENGLKVIEKEKDTNEPT
ncbi:metalloregulator ArsR/SmtB family transcription factor [Peribacillus frigoritolerans]|uniref:ArsR/SmtB family transcription factor n=1 Tax=Peribacillus frigoritolerans TaxID=450367 RepID=UPI00222700E9|nr:metalloregulator ArsR/SmtB family transcription factor [Peribacillus frigoritolerans]QYF83777.1 metalloregulator ArsR/SmtB family transcription factor [Brevibacterium sp. PAMC21349]MCY9006379.1 metalloregulator ArsR/SmtB family transcription factor [Peribacillus frigoritolerans]MEB2629984.1 metalloregulator ArsR/SmtB family transcription factor [Peribacillus frigoritolerans]MED3786042.1 metalloregulator ArsR/SmtB family transcription factor [Peribacillus frigoritolerans]MED3993131.1 metallo